MTVDMMTTVVDSGNRKSFHNAISVDSCHTPLLPECSQSRGAGVSGIVEKKVDKQFGTGSDEPSV